MMDFEAVNSARKKSKDNHKKIKHNFEKEYEQGLQYLIDFTDNLAEDTLRLAADCFFNAVKYNKSRIEPYLYLSYIFYLFEEDELASEYLGIAQKINPEFEKIEELQALLNR